MRFLVLSDLHLECNTYELRDVPAFDAVILAGDIHTPGARAVRWALEQPAFVGKPVLLVPGNHEFYGTCIPWELQAMRDLARSTNVRLLNRTSAVLDDPAGGHVRVLGCTLWTDFEYTEPGQVRDPLANQIAAGRCMNDYALIQVLSESPGLSTSGTRNLSPSDTLERHRSERAWLVEQLATPFDGRTVVVTHHGPSGRSVAPRYRGDALNSSFVSDLPANLFEVPLLWVHGHTHSSVDYQLGNTRVLGNPRGYRRRDGAFENPHFDPHLVVAV